MTQEQLELEREHHLPLKWEVRSKWGDSRVHHSALLIHGGRIIGTYHIYASLYGIQHSSYRWDFELQFEHEDTGDIDVVMGLSSIRGIPELGVIRMKQKANAHRIVLLLRHLGIKEKQI